MRLTTDIWISALLRRVFADGGFGAVMRRGANEAGAVFVIWRAQFGEVALYGPAPQTSYETDRPDERQFTSLGITEQDVADKRLEKELKFDPDIWVVEFESGRLKPEDILSIVET